MTSPELSKHTEPNRILVTGATGFVGKSLVPALIERGYALNLVCRRESLVPDEWLSEPLIKLFRLSELADGAPFGAFEDVGSVIHLAGLAHVGKADQSNLSAEFSRANFLTTQRLTEASSKAGISKFIFLSSIAVVGANTSNVTIDDTSLLEPETDYGRSKLEAERLVAELSKKGIFSVSLRPPLIIGADAKGNWHSLQKLAATGVPLPFGSIKARRSFIGVAMLTQAIVHLVSSHWDVALSGEYCVAASPPQSLPTLLASLRQGMGKPRRLVACPPQLISLLGVATGRRRQIAGLIGELSIDPQRFNTTFGFKPDLELLDEVRRSGMEFVKHKPSERRPKQRANVPDGM